MQFTETGVVLEGVDGGGMEALVSVSSSIAFRFEAPPPPPFSHTSSQTTSFNATSLRASQIYYECGINKRLGMSVHAVSVSCCEMST